MGERLLPDATALLSAGLPEGDVADFVARLQGLVSRLTEASPADLWRSITASLLSPAVPFPVHLHLYHWVYRKWDSAAGPPPAWFPDDDRIEAANVSGLCRRVGVDGYPQLFAWSASNPAAYWGEMVDLLGIRLRRRHERVLDLRDREAPQWLQCATLNIADSCFTGEPSAIAVVEHSEDSATTRTLTFGELDKLSNRVANGLVAWGQGAGDRIAILMPMTIEAVAIYLGIVKAGCAAVGIAESFAADEIRLRLQITGATRLFTQDQMLRGGRSLPLLTKAIEADAPPAAVVAGLAQPVERSATLRKGDIAWEAFLSTDEAFDAVARSPGDHTNILFSSGTTGEPKAIPWTHTTPIKCAADAWVHHDVHVGDVLAWPTSLGWMMGPWLIYASLVNGAGLALFDGIPTGREFGQFVQDARVSMLGVVPSLVRAWRSSGCMEGPDWTGIRTFSSTGESSNADDMLFLMSLAGYRPIIEYCGGTEIGGGYLTGTVVQPASPTVFTTPALGLDVTLVDEAGRPGDIGEVLLKTPSMGFSTELLNANHHSTYFHGTPDTSLEAPLRRHGDLLERLPSGAYRVHGRVDDTMNLGGIKVGSVEIERVLNAVDGIGETAAIAVPLDGGGPSQLVVYAVPDASPATASTDLAATLQAAIRTHLNPLFRIADVVIVDTLPRTASNKTMRRVLRAKYQASR